MTLTPHHRYLHERFKFVLNLEIKAMIVGNILFRISCRRRVILVTDTSVSCPDVSTDGRSETIARTALHVSCHYSQVRSIGVITVQTVDSRYVAENRLNQFLQLSSCLMLHLPFRVLK